ncbi:MAG: DUF2142 domain-containing protein [Lachnospiraceae bacterium]|nr:DUF2142 domain-containing protein [Lachnospiraceae bacterium]
MLKEEIKRTVQNHWLYIICTFVVTMFLGFQIYNIHPNALFIQDDYKDMDETAPLTAIGAKEINSYQLLLQDQTITGIQIRLIDTNSQLKGDETVTVTLSAEQGEVARWRIKSDEIPDDQYIQLMTDQKYTLTENEATVAIASDQAAGASHIALAFDENMQPCIRLIYGSIGSKWSLLLISVVIMLFLLASIFAVNAVKNETLKFAVFLAITGVCYICVVPFSNIPDSFNHFIRAYEVTEGNFYTHDQQDEKAWLPEHLTADLDFQADYSHIYLHRNIQLDDEAKRYYVHDNTALYTPLAYLPHILGILIGKQFTHKTLVLIFFARAFSLAAFVAMVSCAYRMCPVNRGMIAVSALLPITLIEAGSTSLDGVMISILLLGQVYLLILCERKCRLTKAAAALLWVLPLVFSLCKVVYVPFSLLLFLIPKENFGGGRKKGIFIFSSFAAALAAYFAWSAVTFGFVNRYAAKMNGNSSEQIRFILTNPMSYLNVLRNTLHTWFELYLKGMFGGIAGWAQNVAVNSFFPIVCIVCTVIMLIFHPKSSLHQDVKANVVYTLIALSVTALTFTAIYVQYNALKAPLVEGIQGRYFVPLLFPLGFVLSSILKYIYRAKLTQNECKPEEENTAEYQFNRYFYLFATWMNASMMLEMIQGLWH